MQKKKKISNACCKLCLYIECSIVIIFQCWYSCSTFNHLIKGITKTNKHFPIASPPTDIVSNVITNTATMLRLMQIRVYMCRGLPAWRWSVWRGWRWTAPAAAPVGRPRPHWRCAPEGFLGTAWTPRSLAGFLPPRERHRHTPFSTTSFFRRVHL